MPLYYVWSSQVSASFCTSTTAALALHQQQKHDMNMKSCEELLLHTRTVSAYYKYCLLCTLVRLRYDVFDIPMGSSLGSSMPNASARVLLWLNLAWLEKEMMMRMMFMCYAPSNAIAKITQTRRHHHLRCST